MSKCSGAWASEEFFPEGDTSFFQNFSRGALKVLKFGFSRSKLRKPPFLLKFSESKGLVTPLPPSHAHVRACSVGTLLGITIKDDTSSLVFEPPQLTVLIQCSYFYSWRQHTFYGCATPKSRQNSVTFLCRACICNAPHFRKLKAWLYRLQSNSNHSMPRLKN